MLEPVTYLLPSQLMQIYVCANVRVYAYESIYIKEETLKQSVLCLLCVNMFAVLNKEFKWEMPCQETKCDQESLHLPLHHYGGSLI